MERGLRAFFYDYHYYLFPDGMTLEELKASGKVRVRHLREERCMAPDFIYESIAEETLKIEVPERVFEVEVNLYTGAEYDAILKKHVDRVCPGCERYEDDGTDNLDGHHEEMSLDGVCYLRNGEEEPWSFGYCTFVFWLRVADKLNELAACIDADDQEKLNSLINEELEHFYLPLKFYGAVRGGRYCLYLRGDWRNSPSAYTTERYLAECGALATSPLVAAGWRVEYLLPEGVVKHKSAYDERCMGRVEMTEAGTTVYLYVPEGEDSTARANDVFEFMAEDVGEYAALCAFAWVEPTASRVGMLPRKKFARQLKAAADAFLAAMDAEDEHDSSRPMRRATVTTAARTKNSFPTARSSPRASRRRPISRSLIGMRWTGRRRSCPGGCACMLSGICTFPPCTQGRTSFPSSHGIWGISRTRPCTNRKRTA